MSGTLSDLLTPSGDGDGLPPDLRELWQSTEAAPELRPLPAGTYEGQLERVELASSNRGTPCVRLTFRIEGGEHAGRRLRHDAWMTVRAMSLSKRDLQRLGITDLAQVGRPLPGVITCSLRVSVRRDDAGLQFNRIVNFEVLRVDPLPPPRSDPFAPEAPPKRPSDRHLKGCLSKGKVMTKTPSNTSPVCKIF